MIHREKSTPTRALRVTSQGMKKWRFPHPLQLCLHRNKQPSTLISTMNRQSFTRVPGARVHASLLWRACFELIRCLWCYVAQQFWTDGRLNVQDVTGFVEICQRSVKKWATCENWLFYVEFLTFYFWKRANLKSFSCISSALRYIQTNLFQRKNWVG